VRSLWGPECNQTMSLGGPFISDSKGRYRGGFGSVASEFGGCVAVTGTPPAGTTLRETTRLVTGVQLNTTRGDSLVVDLQFPVPP